VNIHHFEETIGGRAYQIEVTAVSNRWRAQLRRLPGMPTAMMPFYGTTPEEAARQLAAWLTLAHRRQSAQLTANWALGLWTFPGPCRSFGSWKGAR